jgi:general secretion pathway protein G
MRAKGFTLVEILIVVVILGILAAIVIPQFTGASTEAKEAALMSDIQSIRSQIELYKIQHNDELPGVQQAGADCAEADFVTAMTTKTDQDGVAGGRFGPYMQSIPDNPFSTAASENSVGIAGTGGTKMDPANPGDNSTAWWFVTDPASADQGLFQANDDKTNVVTGDSHTSY